VKSVWQWRHQQYENNGDAASMAARSVIAVRGKQRSASAYGIDEKGRTRHAIAAYPSNAKRRNNGGMERRGASARNINNGINESVR